MTANYQQTSRSALQRIDRLSERVIFWCMVSAVMVISVAMIRGMLAVA
ncbi:MAG TPA: hypothetical protein VHB46_09250 [Burkholderiales bacterium]|nr:hypothetical protein [Burkholderiales bacterium]